MASQGGHRLWSTPHPLHHRRQVSRLLLAYPLLTIRDGKTLDPLPPDANCQKSRPPVLCQAGNGSGLRHDDLRPHHGPLLIRGPHCRCVWEYDMRAHMQVRQHSKLVTGVSLGHHIMGPSSPAEAATLWTPCPSEALRQRTPVGREVPEVHHAGVGLLGRTSPATSTKTAPSTNPSSPAEAATLSTPYPSEALRQRLTLTLTLTLPSRSASTMQVWDEAPPQHPALAPPHQQRQYGHAGRPTTPALTPPHQQRRRDTVPLASRRQSGSRTPVAKWSTMQVWACWDAGRRTSSPAQPSINPSSPAEAAGLCTLCPSTPSAMADGPHAGPHLGPHPQSRPGGCNGPGLGLARRPAGHVTRW